MSTNESSDASGGVGDLSLLDSSIFYRWFHKPKKDNEDEEERESWGSSLQFFLAALGYTLGLSCVWRFPTLAYEDGGGAFLIPFIFFSFIIGIPMVFLELSVGQYTSTTTFKCWSMTKLFKGVGVAMNFSNAYVCIYYNMIVAYALYYIVLSLTSELPWQNCNPKWASDNCVDDYDASVFKYVACTDPSDYQCSNGKCFNQSDPSFNVSSSCSLSRNSSLYLGWWNPTFPSQDYWNKVVLEKSDSIDDSGGLVWQLVLALLVAWLLIFAMVAKGVQGTGKIVYVTTTAPYVILLILGIQAWTLPGASTGLAFYLKPDGSKLGQLKVWSDAAIQVFYTLSISYGGLLTYASYNPFKAPVLRDSILLSIMSCLTSIFCGLVVFPILGYIAETTGQDIDKIVQSGQGLAFIVFPYAFTQLKGGPFWSILFFAMVVFIGADNMMASVEVATATLQAVFPKMKKTKFRKVASTATMCFLFFLFGLLYCSHAGIYWVSFFDNFSGNWGVLSTALVECVSVALIYGFNNYRADIFIMIGHKVAYHPLFRFFQIAWLILLPFLFIFLIIYGFAEYQRLAYDDGTFYPIWCEVLGNLMNAATVASILIYIGYRAYKEIFVRNQTIKSLREPDADWRPYRLQDRVFANMVRLDDRYTKTNFDEHAYGFGLANEELMEDPTLVETITGSDLLKNQDLIVKKKGQEIKQFQEKTTLPVQMYTVQLPTNADEADQDLDLELVEVNQEKEDEQDERSDNNEPDAQSNQDIEETRL